MTKELPSLFTGKATTVHPHVSLNPSMTSRWLLQLCRKSTLIASQSLPPFSILRTWSEISLNEVEISELFISHPLLRANARLLSSLKSDGFEPEAQVF